MDDSGGRPLWRRIWRNPRHPKVREERFKAIAALFNGAGLALLVGAAAAPFLNPAQQPGFGARLVIFLLGVAMVIVAQVVLGYIVPTDMDDA